MHRCAPLAVLIAAALVTACVGDATDTASSSSAPAPQTASGPDSVLKTCTDGPERSANWGRAQSDILTGQGWDAVEAGNGGSAADLFLAALNSGPERPDAYWGLAVASHAAEMPDAVVDACFARARGLLPDEAGVHADYGRALVVRERNAEAVNAFEQALALDETHFSAHVGMALALSRLGDEAGATVHAERADALRSGG